MTACQVFYNRVLTPHMGRKMLGGVQRTVSQIDRRCFPEGHEYHPQLSAGGYRYCGFSRESSS